MPHITEIFSRAAAADRGFPPSTSFQESADSREPNPALESRNARSAGRWNRRFYYVFRQGRLEMQSFDRLACGW
jgi:hypothetical protein